MTVKLAYQNRKSARAAEIKVDPASAIAPFVYNSTVISLSESRFVKTYMCAQMFCSLYGHWL